MSQRPTTRRILDQLGEEETILGTDYTPADLRLLLPAFLLAVVVMGMMPADWELFGMVLGTLVVLGTVSTIWYAPAHRVAHSWLRDAVNYRLKDAKDETIMLPHDTASASDTARTLTNVESVLSRWNSIERADGALVGAIRVHPANMALADRSDWETASDELADFLRGMSFDVQIYSTARPVDATALVAPYRDRLSDPDVQENDRLRSIINAYRQSLPQEFEQRQTSVREYYVLVAVPMLDVQLQQQGVAETLGELPVIGPLCEWIGAGTSGLSEGERLVLQQRELNSRLQTVQQGITELPGCRPEATTAAQLTELLEEFWTGKPTQNASDDSARQRYHGIPIVQRDTTRDPRTATKDRSAGLIATDGGTVPEAH